MEYPDAAEAKTIAAAGFDPNDPTQVEAHRSVAARRKEHLAALEYERDGYKAKGRPERASEVDEQIKLLTEGDKRKIRTADRK